VIEPRRAFRTICISIICAASLVGAYFAYGPIRSGWDHPVAPAPGPKLDRWATPALILGEGKQNEILTGSFSIRNIGTEPLTFRLDGSCACAELNPKEGEVAPGEVQDITIGVRLREEGRTETVTYNVKTNDPDAAETHFSVNANCPAPFTVTPPRIDLGTVLAGEAVPPVTVVVRAGTGKSPPPVPIFQASSATKGLTVAKADEAGEQRFDVRFVPGADRGAVTGDITLRSPDGKTEVRIPFAAEVVGPLSIAPRSVELRRGKGDARADVLLWRPDGKALGSLDEAACPAGVRVEDLSAPGAVRRRFSILVPEGVALPVGSEVRFRFAGIAERAAVSIRLADATAVKVP
jgi:hypothetical protein